MIPLRETNGDSTRILGFPINQNRLSVPVWSYVMEYYPPRQIVELGSYNGGFALVLGLHAWTLNAEVHSFDTMQVPTQGWEGLADFLNVDFVRGDVFKDKRAWVEELIRQEGLTYLLCDNGDKPREFNEFAPFLKSGDVIAVHDYQTPYWPCSEVTIEEIQDTVGKQNLKPFQQEHFDLAGWLAYRKV